MSGRHENHASLRIADIVIEEAIPHPHLGREHRVRWDKARRLGKARFKVFDARRLEHELGVVDKDGKTLDRLERSELACDRPRAVDHLRFERNALLLESRFCLLHI